MRRLLALSSLFVLLGVAQAAAQDQCTEMVPGPPVTDCSQNAYAQGSADFVSGCRTVPGPPVEVEVPCPARWMPIVTGEPDYVDARRGGALFDLTSHQNHLYLCAAHGMRPASINGQTCASGMWRPTQGEGWQGIDYSTGTHPGGSGGGNHLIWPRDTMSFLTCTHNVTCHVSNWRQACGAVAVYCQD